MVLGHLLYISEAAEPMTASQLEAIRTTSVRYNAEHDITGVLFYSAGHFVQLLEGDTEAIHTLFEKIATDPRHHHIDLLVLRPVNQRLFADWNMGLLDLGVHGPREREDLQELVRLAREADDSTFNSPIEMEILSRFCMLLPGG